MNFYIKAAKELGWIVFYDKNIRLWTFIKENRETEYFTKCVLEQLGIAKFKEFMGRE